MNAKLLFKTIFLMILFLLAILVGVNNKANISFALPPLLPAEIKTKAAIMYFTFFAVGFISGTILTARGGGGKKGSGSAGPSKPSKPAK